MKKALSLMLVVVMIAALFVPSLTAFASALPIASAPFADFYLHQPGSGYAVIVPSYPGMSVTIGQPALIDADKATDKFPTFEFINPKAGSSVSGRLLDPSGNILDTIPLTSISNGTLLKFSDSPTLTAGVTYRAVFELSNSNEGGALFDTFYFTAISAANFATYRSTVNASHTNNANVTNRPPDSRTSVYPALQLDNNNELIYYPDHRGNQIMDYSRVGYAGGGEAIPYVPATVTVSPHAVQTTDMRAAIQAAIDQVSAMPLVDGFRGAVELAAGVYYIKGPLYVRSSGVVIRGAGEGTPTAVNRSGTTVTTNLAGILRPGGNAAPDNTPQVFESGVTYLIADWYLSSAAPKSAHDSSGESSWNVGENNTLINFIGSAPSTTGVTVNVVDQYVGAGQYSIRVADVSSFSVGDVVRVQKAVDANWVKAMYMDRIDGGSTWLNASGANDFRPDASEHTIASINITTNTLTFLDPLPDNLDMRWGTSTVQRLAPDTQRLYNVGIESVQGVSNFAAKTTKPSLSRWGWNMVAWNDESHVLSFVRMVNVRDGWMRNFITYHFDRTFQSEGRSRNITVQDGYGLDPVSHLNAGSRRYTFYISGNSSHVLFNRLNARYARHAFSLAARLPGPNVFVDCYEEYPTNTTEPHFRWSTGGLYDNVTGRIALQNRWNMGTAHGHAGVNYVLYNTTGGVIVSQPQLTPNYVLGHSGALAGNGANDRLGNSISGGRVGFGANASANMASAGLNGGQVPNLPAYEYAFGRHVTPAQDKMPQSLFKQQLYERLGQKALDNLEINGVQPSSGAPIRGTVTVDDEPISGAAVELTGGPTGMTNETRTTSANGAYSFSGLDDGNYIVKVTLPAHPEYTLSPKTEIAVIANETGVTLNFSFISGNALKPVILEQPQGAVMPVNTGSHTFSVNAASLDGGILTYQWYDDGGTPVQTGTSLTVPANTIESIQQ